MARCLLSLLLVVVVAVSSSAGDNNPGTTVHLKDIFTGRCYDYKQVKYKKLMPEVSEDCGDLYTKFFSAFSFQPPCALDMSDYQPFMEAARQGLPANKAMFWSGVKQLAHEYAVHGRRFVTLEDTLIGYVVNDLVWCGQSISPGANYTRCPSWDDCPMEASESFWAAASKTFAESVKGQVTVMMDGSRDGQPAYRRDSFFGKYELPNLSKEDVTGVLVLLTHALDKPEFETCDNGSLVLLKEDVTSHGFPFRCEDDPQAILHLLCVDDPTDRECHLYSRYVLLGNGDSKHVKLEHGTEVLNSKPDRFAATHSIHAA